MVHMNGHSGLRFPAQDDNRRKRQQPESILAGIGLKAGMTFVDVGCGGGFFALPAARIVGDTGMVYGVDIDAQAIRSLQAQAGQEGLKNVKAFIGEAESFLPCEACADIVFFGIVLHDFRDPSQVLVNARRMLKTGGHLVNLDWKKEPMEFGPPLQRRFSEDRACQLIEQAGFSIDSVRDSGRYYYLITATPLQQGDSIPKVIASV